MGNAHWFHKFLLLTNNLINTHTLPTPRNYENMARNLNINFQKQKQAYSLVKN